MKSCSPLLITPYLWNCDNVIWEILFKNTPILLTKAKVKLSGIGASLAPQSPNDSVDCRGRKGQPGYKHQWRKALKDHSILTFYVVKIAMTMTNNLKTYLKSWVKMPNTKILLKILFLKGYVKRTSFYRSCCVPASVKPVILSLYFCSHRRVDHIWYYRCVNHIWCFSLFVNCY